MYVVIKGLFLSHQLDKEPGWSPADFTLSCLFILLLNFQAVVFITQPTVNA